MTIKQAVRLVVLAVAGATLAGCVQHTGTETSTSLGVRPQASATPEVPQRRASVAHQRRVAALTRKHSSLPSKRAASTGGSVGIASFYTYDTQTASGEPFNPRELLPPTGRCRSGPGCVLPMLRRASPSPSGSTTAARSSPDVLSTYRIPRPMSSA
jgi:hypothetical protein